MQDYSAKKGKAGSLTLMSVAVVLFAFLLVLAIITNSIPQTLFNTKYAAVNSDDFSNDDFDDGILASVTYLSGQNVFGNTSIVDCFTYFCKSASVKALNEGFENHLKELWGAKKPSYRFYSGDFDNDGENEYLFAIGNCIEWAKRIGNADVLKIIKESKIKGKDKTVFVYCDVYKSTAVYQFFASGGTSPDVSLCLWDSDRLNIESKGGKAGFFVCDAKTCIYGGFAPLSDKLQAYFYRLGYRYTYRNNATLRAGNNKLAILIYGKDGSNYNAAVCAFKFGRAIPVFMITPDDNMALYMLKNGGYDYLVTYRNWQVRGKYCYEYQKFDFNSDYSINIMDKYSVLEKDASNANKVTEFFERFRRMISGASVCVDPYQLTGYATDFGNYSSDSKSDSNETAGKYLNIDNCDTSKSGIVKIKQEPDNWLNLRLGPAVSYKRVAVAGNFVEQACGSVVTVIDTVNTGNKDNPIWVKIRINYAGETVIGYSSQRYISLDNIRHIKQGEQFTVTANTNDSGLIWKLNDTSVARIDASTGTITGIKRGLLLVTVTSVSGLSDTCLIAVD